MAWLKLDDSIWSHPKFVGLSDTAHTLWVRTAAWCSQYLTDGFLPDSARNLFGQFTDSTVKELVDAGLWHEQDGGWQFHDWNDWNPSAESVKAKREADRLRKAKGNESKKNNPKRFQTDSARNPDGNATESERPVPVPVPNREVPKGTSHNDKFPTYSKLPRTGNRRTYPDEYETFWNTFPHRPDDTDKKGTYTKWRTAVLEESNIEQVQAGADQYRDDPNRSPEYTMRAANWLTQSRWLAGPLPARGVPQHDNLTRGQRAAMTDLARYTAEKQARQQHQTHYQITQGDHT